MRNPENSLRQPSLKESFGNKKVPAEQNRAMRIIDGLNDLRLEERRLLFFYHLWQENNGSFAPIKEFGDIKEDPTIDAMLDRVMNNDNLVVAYDEFSKKFNQKEKYGERLLQLVNEGIGLQEAVEESEISLDSEEKQGTNQQRFAEFCQKVEMIDHPAFSDKEIAIALRSSKSRIKRARKRLRDEGKIRERTRKDLRQAYSRRFFPLRNGIKNQYSDFPIAETAEIMGVTKEQVKHQRAILLKRGEIKRKTRKDTKEKLRAILNAYLNQTEEGTVNLSDIYRGRQLEVSWSTIQSLYHEIAREQPVPVLKTSPRRGMV